MRRVVIWQYVLMGLAWALAAVSWPFRGAELNKFLGWQGELNTAKFMHFLLSQPREIFGGDPAEPTMIQSAWLALVLAGFTIFIFALVMVRRRNDWRAPGQRVIRALGLPLLVLPLSFLAPRSFELPEPRVGLYLVGAAQVVMFVALLLTPAKSEDGSAFPVDAGQRSDGT